MLTLFALVIQIARADTLVVDDHVRCRVCTVTVDSGPQLKSEPRRFSLTAGTSFASTPAGGWVAAGTSVRGQLVEFDKGGGVLRILNSQVTRQAEASGEYMVVAVGEDGSVHAFDSNYARFPRDSSSPDLRLALFGDPPAQVHAAIVFGRSRVLVQAMVPSRDLAGRSFHLIDDRGVVDRSIGAANNVTFLDGFGASRRRLARSINGTFWAIAPNRYELVKWDTLGVARKHLIRKSTWFQEWDGRRSLPSIRRERWPTVVQGIREDEDGRVWVMSWVPDSNWKSQNQDFERSQVVPVLTRRELDGYVDTVIEVLDAHCGNVISRTRFDAAFIGFIGVRQTVVGDFVGTDGQAVFRVLHLRLSGSSAGAMANCRESPDQ